MRGFLAEKGFQIHAIDSDDARSNLFQFNYILIQASWPGESSHSCKRETLATLSLAYVCRISISPMSGGVFCLGPPGGCPPLPASSSTPSSSAICSKVVTSFKASRSTTDELDPAANEPRSDPTAPISTVDSVDLGDFCICRDEICQNGKKASHADGRGLSWYTDIKLAHHS